MKRFLSNFITALSIPVAIIAGHLYNTPGLVNIGLFIAWFITALRLFFLADTVSEDAFKKGRAVPVKLSIVLNIAAMLTLAWYEHFVLLTAFLVAYGIREAAWLEATQKRA